ncbi:MAG: hypothetical protein LAC70_04390 [Methylovulum sp.]|nr:hypothetical protein [Methylovulum sp.]
MTIKNRLDKIAAALAQSEFQHILKIDDRPSTVTGWEHTDGTIYAADADLSHLKGVVILFAIYADD